ncbi:MAG: PAS domain S-box protein [Verrucomicrobia bacterium]|nr:PAS domain S-box protein [Verrucomicrobiota bacterium]
MPRTSTRRSRPADSSGAERRSAPPSTGGKTRSEHADKADKAPRKRRSPPVTAQTSLRLQRARPTRTQLEAQNESLTASELRFRLIMDSAPVLVWVSDTEKQFIWFNKPWLEFTGRTTEQETGEGWAENVHPDDLERCMTLYASSFEKRVPFEMTYRLRRHDGEYRWLLDKGIPLHGLREEFAGYIGSCVDITEQRQTQNELERRVAERTTELLEANAELTAQMEERNRLENALLHISEQEQRRLGQDLHDGLCQSLSGLAFMARSLTKTLEAQALGAVAAVAAEAGRLAELLHRSVEHSRDIAKGLHPVVMDAEGLVSALHELAARSSGGISCRLRCERMVPITDNGVALHLYRIAQEAVTNALKHSGARSITVSLRLRQNQLSLSVADDGCGMPEVIRAADGMGVRLMKYRADVIGADFAIGKRKKHGTRMTCLLQMPAGAPSQPSGIS